MGEAYHSAMAGFPIAFKSRPTSRFFHKRSRITCSSFKSYASIIPKGDDNSRGRGKSHRRSRRSLIILSTGASNRKANETTEYTFTLRELCLADLVRKGEEDTEVFVTLSVQQHTGFGMSVEGRIVTSFTSTCSSCSSSFRREIDTTFSSWILSSNRIDPDAKEVGWSDPSVIYVKPGSEVDLDSVIRETIQLTASAESTCSDACQESPETIICRSKDEGKTSRLTWSRLLEIRDSLEQQQVQ